jgi:hypothetical protein
MEQLRISTPPTWSCCGGRCHSSFQFQCKCSNGGNKGLAGVYHHWHVNVSTWRFFKLHKKSKWRSMNTVPFTFYYDILQSTAFGEPYLPPSAFLISMSKAFIALGDFKVGEKIYPQQRRWQRLSNNIYDLNSTAGKMTVWLSRQGPNCAKKSENLRWARDRLEGAFLLKLRIKDTSTVVLKIRPGLDSNHQI